MINHTIIEKIWKKVLLASFFLYVFFLETTFIPASETSSLDFQMMGKMLIFYGSAFFALAKFSTHAKLNHHILIFYVFIAFIAASVLWSNFPLMSGAYCSVWFIFVIIVLRLLDDCGNVIHITSTLHISLFTICTISLLIYVFNFEFATYYEVVSSKITIARLKGVTGNPNTLASIAGLSLLFSIFYFFTLGYRKNHVVISIFVSSIVLVLTYSRTSQVAALLCSSFLIFQTVRRKNFKKIFLISIFILIVFTFFNFEVKDLVALTKTGESSEVLTLMGRTTIWSEASNKILERPMLGGGLGSAKWIMAEGTFDHGRIFTTSHNFLLEALIELGLLGTFLYFFIFISTFIKIIKRPVEEGSYKYLFLSIMIYLLIIGISEKSFIGPLNTKSAAFVLAVFFAGSKYKANSIIYKKI